MAESRIRIGDGPEIPVSSVYAPVTFSPSARSHLADLLDVTGERVRARAIGVDPDRVIDGELGQHEIEG